jgi:6-pyruvoyltetrahydropterin/6-carboxytetrahydropterin synthase
VYRVAVQRDFIAQHYLIGGDWGAENHNHSHHYRLELELIGDRLDQHNYLVDIVAIEEVLEQQVSKYKDRTLNDLPAFSETNPSLERFARLICEALAHDIPEDTVKRVVVRLWENEVAWAGYEVER